MSGIRKRYGMYAAAFISGLPMEYKENDFFDVTEAITELIRYLRSGNKKKNIRTDAEDYQ